MIKAGLPWPMGAHFDGSGVNIAVFSLHAEAVEVCLFDSDSTAEQARLRLPGRTGDVWHGRIPGAAPGLVYGLRAIGPWQPNDGHRFNPSKLLLDPYAREIVGHFAWVDDHLSAGDLSAGDLSASNLPVGNLSVDNSSADGGGTSDAGTDRVEAERPDTRDNAATALKARVVDDRYDWAGDRRPNTPLADTVVYELHVKGFSKLNLRVPEALRGSYAGLAHPASIAHLKRLGITAVDLLPVHYAIAEERLVAQGLTNYWGYNTLGFFTPDPRLGCMGADGRAVRDEFRGMVRALHAEGIEVILDVVFNHTAESDASGPTLSFRGLDNAVYYRLPPHDRSGYENQTGCGNTLDLRHPRVLQLVTDSLRYWVTEMHVDGFRFDLAPVLGRGDDGFDPDAAFFAAVAQDPVLTKIKLIAEPWDIGTGGYQLGNFPSGWAEWNDKFRDETRSFWLRHRSTRGAFARRLCGSSDLFRQPNRAPAESINYVVSHDGFTLLDVLSFASKRNESNGEGNRDGTDRNFSFNCGMEGPSDDPTVRAARQRLQRALIATCLMAQGTPMLSAGDELGHTQLGNNNPYCHDSPVTWLDWSNADADLIDFTARALAVRRFARPFANRWYNGAPDASNVVDVSWLGADGRALQDDAWHDTDARSFACLINEPAPDKPACSAGSALLLLINAEGNAVCWQLPAGTWRVLLDSTLACGQPETQLPAVSTLQVPAQSVMLLSALAPATESAIESEALPAGAAMRN